jgi:hypothetical protein
MTERKLQVHFYHAQQNADLLAKFAGTMVTLKLADSEYRKLPSRIFENDLVIWDSEPLRGQPLKLRSLFLKL